MKNYSPTERIEQARLFIVTKLHYYASIMYKLNVHEDPSCKTAWTDGVSLGYNPTWLGEWTIPQIIGVFIHEVEHVILKHPLREEMANIRKEDHVKANMAMDYALNPMVIKHVGVELPDGVLLDLDRFPDDTFEKIFGDLTDDEVDKVKKDMDGMGEPGQGQSAQGGDGVPTPMMGEVRPFQEGKGSRAAKEAHGQTIDQWIHQAGMKAKNAGSMTSSLQQKIKGLTAPVVRWEDELQFLCECVCKNDYTWKRPNYRYMGTGCYLPSMHGYRTPDMLFFVDCSGSLNDDQIRQIKGEIRDILTSFNIRVIVVYWDVKFQGMEIFEASDVFDPDWELNIGGRGGTDFSNLLDWMDEPTDKDGLEVELEFEVAAVVMFSDLECRNYPDEEPDVPWLWVHIPTNGRFNDSYLSSLPDWGKHVRCNAI